MELLVNHDRAIQSGHSQLKRLTCEGMKVLVLTLIANGVYEPDWGVRNHRYGMAEYGCLLDDDWQHPQPEELKWIFARQGHVNYDTLYVCSVRGELERIAEKRDKFDTVGGCASLASVTLLASRRRVTLLASRRRVHHLIRSPKERCQ